jgi:phospholipid transport system substrate-binding protein
MKMRHIGWLVAVCVVLGGLPAAAETPASDADSGLIEMMKARDRAIQDIVRSETEGSTESEREQLKAIVGELFDFERLSRKSLGRYWRDRTEAERGEFVGLYRRLIEKNYADPKLYTKSDKIEYLGADVEGAEAVLKTMVYYKTEKSTIDYRFHTVDGKWLIYDMVIDDLSIARNNRSQFYKEIRKSSYEGLVRKLKDKLIGESEDGKG